jgi:hypothetical protein
VWVVRGEPVVHADILTVAGRNPLGLAGHSVHRHPYIRRQRGRGVPSGESTEQFVPQKWNSPYAGHAR